MCRNKQKYVMHPVQEELGLSQHGPEIWQRKVGPDGWRSYLGPHWRLAEELGSPCS